MAAVNSSESLNKKRLGRRESCDTCSSNSSCVLQKRKPLHPLARSVQSKPKPNVVSQRVLSAKYLRFKTLQNQLNDANYHISQLVNENKALKNLQRRQDNALSKYEGVNAQLPQVLESHQEELRIIQAKNKVLKSKVKDLTEQFKTKDEELHTLRDQYKHLQMLCKNKNLEEREKLQDKVEELTELLHKSESTVTILNRKLSLEMKNYKFKLNSEIAKHKETQKELNRVTEQLQRPMYKYDKDKFHSKSTFSLEKKSSSTTQLNEKRVAKAKTEKISSPPNNNNNNNNAIALLDDDSEPYSSTSTNDNELLLASEMIVDEYISTPDDYNIDKFAEKESNQYLCTLDATDYETSSEMQLKEMMNSLALKNDKLEEKLCDELKSTPAETLKNARLMNNLIDERNSQFELTMKNTELIMETLKEVDAKNEKLNQLRKSGKLMTLPEYDLLSSHSENEEKLNQLLKKDSFSSYSIENDILNDKSIKKITVLEPPEVDQKNKEKLLAKLKAIDNGENDEINVPTVVPDLRQTKSDLIKELFG